MRVQRLIGGAVETCTYFVINDVTKECVVIDPHEDIKSISGYISQEGLTPKASGRLSAQGVKAIRKC